MSQASILAGLSHARIDFVLIGGIAANAHGSARVTFDVDICYDPAEPNRERLARRLNQWRAHLRGRGVPPDLPFVIDARTLRDVPVLTLDTDEGQLDVMDIVAGVGDFAQVLAASEPATLFELPTRILTLDALIAAKRATGRRKDTEALLELEALREMRRQRGL